MTRQQITDVFIVRAAPADRTELRRKLDRMSLDELEEAYKIIQLQAKEEQLFEIQADRAAAGAMYRYYKQKEREPQRVGDANEHHQDNQPMKDTELTHCRLLKD